ncbi:MAG: helix-turn-helix transcriptional regulator [Hydrogenoanaerobacterium sp.]
MKVSYKKLWKLLIDMGLKRAELKVMTGFSSNTIAKLGGDEYVSMDALVKICTALQVNIGDIMDVII